MNTSRIPGGLTECSTEFFTVMVAGEREPACTTSGRFYSFNTIPARQKAIVYADMMAHPLAEAAMTALAGSSDEAKLKQYIMCRYGALNHEADIDCNGKLSEPEYVPCAMRGTCKFEGIGCCAININGSILSKAETSVFKLVELPDKLIGDRLFLSVETVKKHFQNIRFKTGLRNKIEMAVWATQKGII